MEDFKEEEKPISNSKEIECNFSIQLNGWIFLLLIIWIVFVHSALLWFVLK